MASLAQNSSGAIRCSCSTRLRRRFRRVPEPSGADGWWGSGGFRCRWLMRFRRVPVQMADEVPEPMADEVPEGSGGFRCRWLMKFRLVPVQVADKVAELSSAHSRQSSGGLRYKNLPRSSKLFISQQFRFDPDPTLSSNLHQNPPEPHQLSAPKFSGTSSAICPGTLRNLISHLRRNLVLQLRRITPGLFWAKDTTASFAVGEKHVCIFYRSKNFLTWFLKCGGFLYVFLESMSKAVDIGLDQASSKPIGPKPNPKAKVKVQPKRQAFRSRQALWKALSGAQLCIG